MGWRPYDGWYGDDVDKNGWDERYILVCAVSKDVQAVKGCLHKILHFWVNGDGSHGLLLDRVTMSAL